LQRFRVTRADIGSKGTPAVDNLEQNLSVGGEMDDSAISQDTPVFEKYNPLLHAGVTASSGKGANKKKEVLAIAFVKKYVQYAKNRIQPVLTTGAAEHIVAVYSALRNDDLGRNQKRVSSLGV
jgi:DNA replication licensing factor MCM3